MQIKLVGLSVIFIVQNFMSNKSNGLWVVSIKCDIQILNALHFCFCVYSQKVIGFGGMVRLSCEHLSAQKMSWYHVDWCKFYIRLTSLNFRHFEMIKNTELQYGVGVTFKGMASWLDFINNTPIGLKIYWGITQTDGHTDRTVTS
jgi:hypothetical protein